VGQDLLVAAEQTFAPRLEVLDDLVEGALLVTFKQARVDVVFAANSGSVGERGGHLSECVFDHALAGLERVDLWLIE
jgi:hypothetical protein